MKLLIVTQKVDKNDPVLGFFHAWLIEFAKHVEKITILALNVGVYDLPKTVHVIPLGKDEGKRKTEWARKFLHHVVHDRGEYDAVFVHMNPIYIALAGLIWKGMGKRVLLWYTHRNVDLKLRLAVLFSDIVLTASPEGCRVKSKKVHAIGHGVDVDSFKKAPRSHVVGQRDVFRLAHFGRITPIKNCDTIIEACGVIGEKMGKPIQLVFVGGPTSESDKAYQQKLESLVKEKKLESVVTFLGHMKPHDMPAYMATVDATINATPTGGLDKVVLESAAAGVPFFTSNTSFGQFLKDDASRFIFPLKNAPALAEKIGAFFSSPDKDLALSRIQKMSLNFSIPAIVEKILKEIEQQKV